jgi:cation diffusion facilitator family transporter
MKVAAARLSILSNSALVLIKLVIGIVTGSVSVVAEAAHSAVDLVASIIAFLSVRVSDRPADRDHPFGHGKFENLSGMAEGALILLGGGVIVFEAVRSLLSGDRDIQTGLGLVAMGISAVANTIISRMLFRVAKQTDSAALEADAQHLATDVYTSAGVFGGLLVIKLTGLEALDPVIAIVVALLILKIGWETTAASVRQLADTGLPTSEVNRIEAILDRHPEILGHHKLRSRKSGPQREVDVHIKVDSRLSVETAHRVAHEAQDQIRSELGTAHVVIHVEPWTVADEANSK